MIDPRNRGRGTDGLLSDIASVDASDLRRHVRAINSDPLAWNGVKAELPARVCRLCHSTLPTMDGRCQECDWDGDEEGDDRYPGYTERERVDGLD